MSTELNRTRGQRCISDLRFDRMFAGELGDEETRAIDAHLTSCATCRARREEIAQAQAAGAGTLAAEAGALHARATGGRRKPRAAIASGALALVALAAGVWLAVAPARPPADPGEPGEQPLRFKGGHGFGFYVQRGAAVYRGGPGERLLAGDRLRFVARTREPRYLAVLSLDGAQRATVYFPSGARAAELAPGEVEQALPASVQLDDVLGPERLYALFCVEPLALEPLRSALAQQRHAFAAPAGCELERLLVHKAAP
jgi:anti-sigma factor RsiW